jgi:hypothetical protein
MTATATIQRIARGTAGLAIVAGVTVGFAAPAQAATPVALASHSASYPDSTDHSDYADSTDTESTETTETTDTGSGTYESYETEPTHEATDPDHPVTVVFEASGSGQAYGIATDPGEFANYVQLPYRATSTVPADIDLLQIAVSGGDGGCRIILDGKVVAEQAPGEQAAHCVYQR